jgi:hypothetical protein
MALPIRTVVAASVVALTAWWFWPTDTRRIVGATRELAEAASIPVSEPDLARVTRAAALARLLDQNVQLVVPSGRSAVEGRDAALALATRLRPPLGLKVSVGDVEVALNPDGATATSQTVVTLAEPGEAGAPETRDVRIVTMDWVKSEGWHLAKLTVLDGPDSR